MPELEAVDGATVVPARNRTGRPKGSRNKITRDLKEAACKYTLRSLRVLYKLASESPEPMVRLKAACELLDRAHGRPATTQLVGGDGGVPIRAVTFQADVTRLAEAFAAEPPFDKVDGPLLEAAQVVGFAAELARRTGKPVLVPPEAPQDSTHVPPAPGQGNSTLAPDVPVVTPEADTESIQSEPEPRGEPVAPAPGERLRFPGCDYYIEGHVPDRANTPPVFEFCNSAGMVCRGSFDRVMTQLRRQVNDDPGDWRIEGAPPGPNFEPARPDQEPTRPAPVVRRGWEQRRRRG